MKPSELLREVKRRLLAGPARKTWTRGSYGHGRGPRCVIGHLTSWDLSRAVGDAMPGARYALDHAASEMSVRGAKALGAMDLNDHGPTRLWGVVAMLGRAIRRLEAEGR